jgi:hypothetical protein
MDKGLDITDTGTIQQLAARHWTTGPFGVGSAKQTPRATDLMRIGIGLVLVMRKRIAQGLPQATGTQRTPMLPSHCGKRRSAELFFFEKNYSAVRLQMRVRGSAGNNTRSTTRPLGVIGAGLMVPV